MATPTITWPIVKRDDLIEEIRLRGPLADRCRMGIRGACGHIEPRVPGEVRCAEQLGAKPVLSASGPFQQPNAWGLHDLASGWWELVADQRRYNGPDAEVDPLYVPLKDEASREHTHWIHGLLTGPYPFGTIENIPSGGNTYVGTKFRIVWWSTSPTRQSFPPRASRKRPGGRLNRSPTAMGDRP